jgi:hypothetical protein
MRKWFRENLHGFKGDKLCMKYHWYLAFFASASLFLKIELDIFTPTKVVEEINTNPTTINWVPSGWTVRVMSRLKTQEWTMLCRLSLPSSARRSRPLLYLTLTSGKKPQGTDNLFHVPCLWNHANVVGIISWFDK